jgi:hypothetical protein
MQRNDKSVFLLYIEPPESEKLKEPILDDLSDLMDKALFNATVGTANYSDLENKPKFRESGGYRGCHNCNGAESDNKDYLLENGLITNSLCAHYIQFYRNSINRNDINKLKELAKFYNKNIDFSKITPNERPTIDPRAVAIQERKEQNDKLVNSIVETEDKRILNELLGL